VAVVVFIAGFLASLALSAGAGAAGAVVPVASPGNGLLRFPVAVMQSTVRETLCPGNPWMRTGSVGEGLAPAGTALKASV